MVKPVIGLVTLSIVLLTSYSCDFLIGSDEELTLAREDYLGAELRLDGIYYCKFPNEKISRYALYSNGIFRDLGTSFKDEILVNFVDSSLKYRWGIFLIENNTITIERWHINSGGIYEAYISKGNILNDTTFQILESYSSYDEEDKVNRDITYHFYKTSPKPDSTNSFID